MGEPSSVFTRPGSSASSSEVVPPSGISDVSRRKQPSQQSRQLLSCTKCRERKVKCDRTKPCSACCARGAPKDCHFIAEGGDYAPIQQSYELRKLRAENLRLKEQIRANKMSIEDDESDPAGSPESHIGDRSSSSSQKRRVARQKRFQGSEWSDSIYFGSPGLANVITDFATVNITPISTGSLAHLMPRGSDMYTPKNPPPHPFPTLFKATPNECIPELLRCIPTSREELFEYLAFFEKRVNVCSFPHIPIEITRSEVERFLSDDRKNAQMCPDMLALLFAALALGAQHSVWDKSGGKWEADVMDKELQKGNVYMAAAMQALRMASFMHKPSLLGIQALIMLGPYLTNSGRFLDAWTLFGTTIRLAHSIGLHRHPKYLDPAPPTQSEFSIRQTLWWWMLHMDEQYSMTLGRPLGISGIGDCPPPHELTTNPHMLRFGEFVNHFTLLGRQILSSDRLTNSKIDEFTDSLRGLLDTMPEMLQFDESWIDEDKEIPEWPLCAMAAVYYCKTHNYLILLNRQRTSSQPASLQATGAKTVSPLPAYFHPVNAPTPSHSSPTMSPKASLRGRPLVLSSSEDLLAAFLFFRARIPAALICWNMGQQAFNSCMILLLDAMETGDLSRIWKVEKAYVVFKELHDNGVHKLASLAVERMSWGLEELRKNVSGASMASSEPGGNQNCHVEMQGFDGCEARHGSGVMHDTVMGNTGMFLLEDPGLQSFVSEAFTPFTWGMGNRDLRETTSLQTEQDQETKTQEDQQQLDGLKVEGFNEDVHDARSTEELQGVSASTQNPVTVRYGSFSTAPPQELPQPQGPTVSASPTISTTSMQQRPHDQKAIQRQLQHQELLAGLQHHPSHHPNEGPPSAGQGIDLAWECDIKHPLQLRQGQLTADSSGLHGLPPPHLRHHSYPSLLQDVPSPLITCPPYTPVSAVKSEDPNAKPTPRKKMATSNRGQAHIPLQTLPEFISQSTHQPENPSVHPSWAARPVAPMTSISEPALSFTYMADRTHIIPASSEQTTPQSTNQCTFPFHFTNAVSAGTAAIAGTHAEHMEIDGWR